MFLNEYTHFEYYMTVIYYASNENTNILANSPRSNTRGERGFNISSNYKFIELYTRYRK